MLTSNPLAHRPAATERALCRVAPLVFCARAALAQPAPAPAAQPVPPPPGATAPAASATAPGGEPGTAVAPAPATKDAGAALERELKGKLILLRNACVSAAGGDKALRAAMTASLPSVLVLCRAALRLRSGSAPVAKLAAAEELGKAVGADVSSFAEIQALRAGGRVSDAGGLFARYLGAAEALADAVDRWEH